MSHHRRSIPLVLVLALGVVTVGCDDPAPTNPAPESVAAPAFSADAAATTERETFVFPDVTLVPDATCLDLGEDLPITGSVSGWIQTTTTSDGRVHVSERLDFTDLTASAGGHTWTAGPGAHEVWSVNLGVPGEYALNVTHEGHSRFVGLDGAPDFLLVHRIHQVLTPGLELVVNEITGLAVQCVGGGV